MAASTQYNGLGSAARSQDYRVQRKGTELVGGNLDWMEGVRASSSRAAAQNTTATQVAGLMGKSGIEGITTLGATNLRAQSDLAGTGLGATASVTNHQIDADALIEREKIARGDQTLQYLKFAGALGLGALGLSQI